MKHYTRSYIPSTHISRAAACISNSIASRIKITICLAHICRAMLRCGIPPLHNPCPCRIEGALECQAGPFHFTIYRNCSVNAGCFNANVDLSRIGIQVRSGIAAACIYHRIVVSGNGKRCGRRKQRTGKDELLDHDPHFLGCLFRRLHSSHPLTLSIPQIGSMSKIAGFLILINHGSVRIAMTKQA